VSSPHLLRTFRAFNQGKSYADSIKPFNFLLSAQVAAFGHPVGVKPERFHLVSPFSLDSDRWTNLDWLDVHSRGRFGVVTGFNPDPSKACLRSHQEVLSLYRVHPEPKSAAPNGTPCDRATQGLLKRRHLRVVAVELIGKESNRMEDVQNGLVHDWDEVVESFGFASESWWEREVLPKLREAKARDLAKAAGVSVRHIKAIRNGRSGGSPQVRGRLFSSVLELTPVKDG
jgi:hypothetical protein